MPKRGSPKARGNGQGSVYRTSVAAHVKAPWVAVVTTGHQLDGRPIRRFRYRSSPELARAALRSMLDDRAAGRPVRDDRMTVAAFTRSWLGAVAVSRRPATYRTYRSVAATWIAPIVGDVALVSLSVAHVRAFVARVAEDGGPKMAHFALTVLRAIIAAAEREELVTRNVASLVLPPPSAPPSRETLTSDEARAILGTGGRWHAAWAVLLSGGLRASELAGLCWEDRRDDTLLPSYQLVRFDGAYALGPLKTGTPRVIGLPPVALAALDVWHTAQAAERLAAGPAWKGRIADGANLMFTLPDGAPVPRERLWKEWQMACDAAGIARRSVRAARHFVASYQTAAADLKVAQQTLGHTHADLTASTYAHAVDGARRAASAMQEALG